MAADSWYYEAVKYVTDQGIMNGTTPTTFSPHDHHQPGYDCHHALADGGEPCGELPHGLYRCEGGRLLCRGGPLGGIRGDCGRYEDGTFGPDKTVTREQMATILYRYAQEKQYDVSGRNDLSAFADAARVSAYAKEAMQWAVDAGLISGIGGTTWCPRTAPTAPRWQPCSCALRKM